MALRNIAYSGWEKRMSQEQSAAAVAEPDVRERQAQKPRRKPPKRQPRYHVILWNDDDHTFEYVVDMMAELFAHPKIEGQRIVTRWTSPAKPSAAPPPWSGPS